MDQLTGALGIQSFMQRVTGAPPPARSSRPRRRWACGRAVSAAWISSATWVHSYPSDWWTHRLGATEGEWDLVEVEVDGDDLVVAVGDEDVALRVIPALLSAVPPWECSAVALPWPELVAAQQELSHVALGREPGARVPVPPTTTLAMVGVLVLLLGDNDDLGGWTLELAGRVADEEAAVRLLGQLLRVRPSEGLLDTPELRALAPTLLDDYLTGCAQDPEAYVGLTRPQLERAAHEVEIALG